MEKNAGQDRFAPHEVRGHFDATLAQHMERLIGTSKGIGALPLNLATISCLGLLAERETEIKAFPSNPPERYTHQTFHDDLVKLGLDSHRDVKTALQDMVEKEYLEIDANGSLFAKKPAVSMAKLLDQVFPGMPVMNLLAYLVQTIDEVLSGRKELESAINQFYQTLRVQGVRPSREKHRPEMAATPDRCPQQPTGKKRLEPSNVYRRRKAETRLQTAPVSASEPRIVSANGQVSQFEVKELFPKAETSAKIVEDLADDAVAQSLEKYEEPTGPELEPRPTELPASIETEAPYEEPTVSKETTLDISPESDSEEPRFSGETLSEDAALEEVPSDQERSLPLSEPVERETNLPADMEGKKSETKADQIETGQTEEGATTVETEHEVHIISEAGGTIRSDDLIGERIAAFEQDLAMVCPVCTTGKIKGEQTVKGKLYYVCSNKNCVFVSWGKPYHIVCPRCRNPFLIESTERHGKTILRCPRATCHHRQQLPGETSDSPLQDTVSTSKHVTKSSAVSRNPRRRVVKRRRVRRKGK